MLAISKQKTALPPSRRQKLRNQGKVFFKMHAIVYFLTEIKVAFLTRLLLFQPLIFCLFLVRLSRPGNLMTLQVINDSSEPCRGN